MTNASDWMGVNCGDLIHERDNPRHIGRIDAVSNTLQVKVRWLDSRFVSYLALADVVIVKKASTVRRASANTPMRASMPKPDKHPSVGTRFTTVVESPKRQLERYFKERSGR